LFYRSLYPKQLDKHSVVMKVLNATTLFFLLIYFPLGAHTQLWKQYTDSARHFEKQQQSDKAIDLYSKAKEALQKDSIGTNTYAGTCNILANLYVRMGQYEKAEPLYLEAKQIREKVLGKHHPDYAATCRGLANLHRDMGQYAKAEPLYLAAKQIQEDVLGKRNPDYASTCNNLAILYHRMGHYEKAELLYMEAKQIREKILGKLHPDYATSCNNLAILYYRMGQYSKAEQLYLEAKQIREQVLGRLHPDYSASCNNLALLYYKMGHYEKAESLYLEAKQIWKKIVGKLHPNYAHSSNNLADLYTEIGQYSKAEPLYLEAKQIWEQVLGKFNPDYANSCNNLAKLYHRMGQYAKAEPLYLEAKQIQEQVVGKLHPDYAESCNNLSLLYADMGQYKKAEPLFLEAMQIQEQVLGKLNPDYATSCNNLAILYYRMEQYSKAEQLYLEAKQIREKVLGRLHPDYFESCIDLANLYRNEKEPDKVKYLYAEAFTSQQIQIKNIFRFTSEREKQDYLKNMADLESYILSFDLSAITHPDHGFSYNLSLSHRNLILSSSQQLRQAIYNTTNTSIQNKYKVWMEVREQLAYWYAKPVTERQEHVQELEEQANIMEKELTRISYSFRKEQVEKTISWKDIQQSLQPSEAAIEFVKFNFYNGRRWTDSTWYVALLITKSQPAPQLIPLFESRQSNIVLRVNNTSQSIYALYPAINKLYSRKEGVNTAYNLIWEPVDRYLSGIKKIYFAPSGLLFRISLAALPVNDHQVLSDKYELVQLNTTAAVVNKAANVIDSSHNIYVYGAIRYDVDSATLKQVVMAYQSSSSEKMPFLTDDLTRGESLQYLAGSEKEIKEIDSIGKQRKYAIVVLSGDTATEESIKALNGTASPTVLHIATHGFFFPDPKETKNSNGTAIGSKNTFRQSDNPLMRSGLFFAGATSAWKGKPVEGMEDGILTSYEVSNLYLPNTKLAVLSACQTALGDIQGNEGVYGLQRAFKIAGVQNLVMSLWKVPDRETAEFMQVFYQNIFNHKSIDEAFYNAQTIMKNKYRNEPFKWAAWVLVR
jgi:CHAT domain-containing protein